MDLVTQSLLTSFAKEESLPADLDEAILFSTSLITQRYQASTAMNSMLRTSTPAEEMT